MMLSGSTTLSTRGRLSGSALALRGARGLRLSGSGSLAAILSSTSAICAHAHTNLLGWVTMAIFGGFYALSPAKAETRLATIHFWSYLGSVAVMSPSLYLMYLGYAAFEMPLALASIIAFLSMIVFAFVVFSAVKDTTSAATPSMPAE